MSENITLKIDPTGEPIAIIWDTPANKNCFMTYQHVGQHSEASIEYIGIDCKRIKSTEDIIKACTLVQELKSIGYDVE